MTKNKRFTKKNANKVDKSEPLESLHNIFREVKTESRNQVLNKFKSQVYKEVEKYEACKNMLQEEIESSMRKIKSLVIVSIVISLVFLLVWIL